MSLFKQLLIAICLFLVVAFTGSFMVSLESSRTQYVNQLRSHAQDAATALALSLTPNIDDPAMVELLVSSIFDSGYYASIRVVDVKTDQTIVERNGAPTVSNVPDWFVKLIGLEPAGGDALVSRGWEQAARVEVVSHPMFAVAKLWQSALGSLGWLLVCGAVSAVLGALLLRRQLKPLDYMVKQSHAIARREFLSLPDLPRTPELRRVVQAMNQMVEKLKALFQEQAERSEKLRAESYQDNLTGLANRRYFEMQLNNRVSNPEQASSGYLLLLRVQDLAGLNQRLGGQRTDELLKAVGEQLSRECAKYPETQNLVTRIRGGEFAVLAPGLVREEALQLAQNLDYVDSGRAEGAELLSGGTRLDRDTEGYFMAPTVFAGTLNDMRINREEMFAPITCVMKVDSYEEGLALANDSPFGLTAAIMTRSLARASHFRANMRAGCVMVNLPTAGTDYHVPFGGRGASSYGPREQGSYAAEFYTTVKTAYVAAGVPE